MKKTVAIILALLLALSLTACGDKPDADAEKPAPDVQVTATPEATPEATPDAAPEVTPEPTPEPTTEPTPEPTPEPAPEESAAVASKADAEALIGATVEELFAAIGEPDSSDYAPSCIGPGEDGNLYYEDFVVYTYREDGTETVEYVE